MLLVACYMLLLPPPQVVCGTTEFPTATIRIRGPDNIPRVSVATGTGPVDAAYRAIDKLIAAPCKLVDYSVNSVTDGIDAQAVTRVLIEPVEKLADRMQVKSMYGSLSAKKF